jgi:hypothetical protein
VPALEQASLAQPASAMPHRHAHDDRQDHHAKRHHSMPRDSKSRLRAAALAASAAVAPVPAPVPKVDPRWKDFVKISTSEFTVLRVGPATSGGTDEETLSRAGQALDFLEANENHCHEVQMDVDMLMSKLGNVLMQGDALLWYRHYRPIPTC